MPTLGAILDQIRNSQNISISDLEAAVGNEIAALSGSRRGVVSESQSIAVRKIPLNSRETAAGLESTVGWIARRVREATPETFSVALRQQPGDILVVAEWSSVPRADLRRDSRP
jgi:hypothetical protein